MEGTQKYWIDLFPVLWKQVLEHMVTCGGKYKMEQLELMPRWVGKGNEDIMGRYTVFKTGAELIAYCQRTNPSTLQLGGIFPLMDEELCVEDPREGRVRDRQLIKAGICNAGGPLKIDLDIKDYDRSGICDCKDAKMCTECWDEFMHSSRIIIDYILRNIFKLSNIYHFWSGNRGLHIWCFDERVIRWTKSERTTFIESVKKRENFQHVLPQEFESLPWPKFDAAVTQDPMHALGLPFGPHHTTKAIRVMLPYLSDMKAEFDPQMRLKRSNVNVVTKGDLQPTIEFILKTWK